MTRSRITYHVTRIKTIGILICTLLLPTAYFLQPTAVSATMWHCTACSCDCNTSIPGYASAYGPITWRYPGDSVDPEGACVTACREACTETISSVFDLRDPAGVRRIEIPSGVPSGNFVGRGLTCAVVPGTETAEPASSTPAAPAGPSSIALYNPLGEDIGVAEFISRGLRTVIGFVGALALLMFVYGGVMWMTAGDSKRIDTAKEILKNSTIGLLLIFFSYSIVSVVFSLLGSS